MSRNDPARDWATIAKLSNVHSTWTSACRLTGGCPPVIPPFERRHYDCGDLNGGCFPLVKTARRVRSTRRRAASAEWHEATHAERHDRVYHGDFME